MERPERIGLLPADGFGHEQIAEEPGQNSEPAEDHLHLKRHLPSSLTALSRKGVGSACRPPDAQLVQRSAMLRSFIVLPVSLPVIPPLSSPLQQRERRTHADRRASTHRLVASSTANTAARSALSLTSAVPVIT